MKLRPVLSSLLLACWLMPGAGAPAPANDAPPAHERTAAPAARKLPPRQVGKASYYHPRFHGRTMADGTRMQPQANNAASKTLPLGTKARVTNLENGQSAVVEIRDRGPYVKGRIVDLSPGTAREIGLGRKQGLAKVEVVPLELPPAEGQAN